jgi:hypothetical protein
VLGGGLCRGEGGGEGKYCGVLAMSRKEGRWSGGKGVEGRYHLL